MAFETREQRRAAERDRQRNEILDVARREFAAKGFGGVLMNEIAERSGYSVGHIYNVIGTKDALFEAVLTRDGIQLAALVETVCKTYENKPVREFVDGLTDTVMEFFESHREFFEIYHNEAGGFRANIERRWARTLCELKNQTDQNVRRLFARAVREGEIADLDPGDVAVAFTEMLNGFIASWAAGGYEGNVSEKSNVIKHILWNGIQK